MTSEDKRRGPQRDDLSPGINDPEADSPTLPPQRPKPLWRNMMTMIGLPLAAVAVVLLVTFWLFSIITPTSNPYLDIIGFMILPGLLVAGLVLMPLGILIRSWRLRRRNPEQKLVFQFPRIDLTDPGQRRVLLFIVGGTFVFLPLVGISSYEGYHYTDSTQFCANACHAVMEPQATTYSISAHARVTCAECHIGSGASWFVKSKLSGTRQVFATLAESYPRPIPTAITELRPARETCEQCHWPKKFFGDQLLETTHFSSNEENSRTVVRALLKTGGADDITGRAEGIHMHMLFAGRLEFVATDEKLQEIPWIKWVDNAGNEVIYRSDGRPASDPVPEGRRRQLDCMDCHNRPAHKFLPPDEALNAYMATGRIDPALPYIKREASRVLLADYPDVATAELQIGEKLVSFYEANYPDLVEPRKAAIHQAIDAVRTVYRHNFFPYMNVDWKTYPDNIGHLYYPGCFRCHDGKHVNQHGQTISHDCTICHTFLNPIDSEAASPTLQQGSFRHPLALEGAHAIVRCDLCHTGGVAPLPTCAGCHADIAGFRAGTLGAFASFDVEPEPMADFVDCEGCHDVSQAQTFEAINETCMDCHDDDEERFDGMLADWMSEFDERIRAAQGLASPEQRDLIRVLLDVNPNHNPPAARKILDSITGDGKGE